MPDIINSKSEISKNFWCKIWHFDDFLNQNLTPSESYMSESNTL